MTTTPEQISTLRPVPPPTPTRAPRAAHPGDRSSRSPRARATRTLAAIVPAAGAGDGNPYLSELLAGIRARARALGCRVAVVPEARPASSAACIADDVAEAEGVLRVATWPDRVPAPLRGRPLLAVDGRPIGRHVDHVKCDYAQALAAAADHLNRRGYRRVALLTPAAMGPRRGEFLPSGSLAMLRLAASEVMEVAGYEASGYRVADYILRHRREGTAIVTVDDRVAAGVLRYLDAHPLPWRVGLVALGSGDIGPSPHADLACVRLPLREVGELACARLVRRLGEDAGPVAVAIPCRTSGMSDGRDARSTRLRSRTRRTRAAVVAVG